ncbi:MAG: hypothetical protein ACJ8DC_14285 [Gemmatimonadales bacterium]
MNDDDSTPSTLSDTPLVDRMWDGLVAWMRGTFVVIGTALAVAGTLGLLCRHAPGALAVAFMTGVPASFAVLMSLEWRDPSEPLATWASLLAGSLQLAVLESAPMAYLLWCLGQRMPSR